MPNFISKIRAKIRAAFGKKPKAPKRPGAGHAGHRGQHWTSKPKRVRKLNAGQAPFTPEEMAKWENLTPEETEAFVYAEFPLRVHSSNVQQAQYIADAKKLKIWFLKKGRAGGGIYEYSEISEDDAWDFALSISKGSYVWDHLRVRGSKWGAQKPFRRLH